MTVASEDLLGMTSSALSPRAFKNAHEAFRGTLMEENISRAAGAVPQLIDVKASEQLVAPLQRNFRQKIGRAHV